MRSGAAGVEGSGVVLTCVLVASWLLAPPVASGQEAPWSSSFSAAGTMGGDQRSPVFQSSDLIYAGVFLGALAAIYPLEVIDEGLAPQSPPGGVPGGVFAAANVTGNAFVSYGLGGATFLLGTAIGDSRVARIGFRSLEALLVSDAIVTPFKIGVGRRRPAGEDPDSDEFDSFPGTAENYSFPSGHTAHVFALASTLSRELGPRAPWVPYVAYSVAGLTGVSRVARGRHWPTDVVAGAAAGLFAGHFVGRLHSAERPPGAIAPVISAGGGGMVLGASVRLP